MTLTQKVILSLQVSGFAAALALLFISAAPHWLFVVAFGVHFVGDMLFLSVEGLPKMSFNIDNFIKVKPWLQFVGVALALVALYFIPAVGFVPHVAKGVSVFGGFLSLAGFVYDLIYPG